AVNPIQAHNGNGEEAAFIDVRSDASGVCHCGIYNERLEMAVSLEFQKEQLPWLTNWQHWGRGEYVCGLEPGTHPPVGQQKARSEGTLLFLQAGETKQYDVVLEVLHKRVDIAKLLDKTIEN